MEVKSETLLPEYSNQEKAAYLGVLAALATAGREANGEELNHLREIARKAAITSEQEQNILEAAKDTSANNLKKCLDTMKGSDLRYSLITDLITLAKADDSFTEEEKGNIEKVAQYLDVSKNQFSVLDQLVNKAAEEPRTPEEYSKPDFLQSTGMQEKFSNAGFDLGPNRKSVFGFLATLLIGSIAGRALGSGRRGTGGLGGGLLGGLLGGATNSGIGLPGGLGDLESLISGLNRSRSNQSMGGILEKLFR